MTVIKPNILAPFSVVSSSVTTGYLSQLDENSNPIGNQGFELVNAHEDEYSEIGGGIIQSPFTEQWVGGHSHRHIKINLGTDNASNRPEAWHINIRSSGIRLLSHKIYNTPPAILSREEVAKRPINVKNILTTTASVNYGNFRMNYEIVHSAGRSINSFLKNIITGSENAGYIRSRFVTHTNAELDNTRRSSDVLDGVKNKTVIVSRFNAPGDIKESSRASLDVASEEISPNISLNYRNHNYRKSLLTQLTGVMERNNSNNMIHGVNRNILRKNSGIVENDNFFVQRLIPRTDIQYQWITSSALTTAIQLGGYQSGAYNKGGAFNDILFAGTRDNRVLNSNKKEYIVDLADNSITPITKVKLDQYSVESFPTGNIDSQGFSLSGRSSIRTKGGLPWVVLLGDSANGKGILKIEYKFTTPIILQVTSIDRQILFADGNNSDDGDNLNIEISLDNGLTWTTNQTIRFGSTSNQASVLTEKIGKYEININTPFYLRLTVTDTDPDQGWAVRNIKTYPRQESLDDPGYQFPIWKQIRTGEHEAARKLRESNKISIVDVPKPHSRTIGGHAVSAAKRENIKTFLEPPVSFKYKPLRHRFIFKGNTNPLAAHEVVHTYNNNLSMFANKQLNDKLGIEEIRDQVNDRLVEMYSDPNKPERDNPIGKFLGYSIEEVIYPKEENAGFTRTRSRTNYLLNKSGLDRDGFDRQFGTQRSFWRENLDGRRRSESGSINSQNQFVGTPRVTSSINVGGGILLTNRSNGATENYKANYSSSNINFGQNSVWPLDVGGPIQEILTQSVYNGSNDLLNYEILYRFQNTGELNNIVMIHNDRGSVHYKHSHLHQLSVQTTSPVTRSIDPEVGIKYVPPRLWQFDFTGSTFVKPQIAYVASIGGFANSLESTQDSGLRNAIPEMTDKRPWFDSYEDFVEDIRPIAKDYSIIPEFRISEHMPYYVKTNDGNFRAKNNAFLTLDGAGIEYRSALAENGKYSTEFFKCFVNSDDVKNRNSIEKINSTVSKLNGINIKVSGIKKLLPYNGFYPIQRTVQLANLYSEYVDEKFHGGLMILSQVGDVNGYTMQDLEVNTPRSNLAFKQAALEPIFAPGILYNTIKSGISVDWPAITGSISVLNAGNESRIIEWPSGPGSPNAFESSQRYRRQLDFRIPFESIIFPELGFKTKTLQTASFLPMAASNFFNDPYFIKQQTVYDNLIQDVYCLGRFETTAYQIANSLNYNRSVPYTYLVQNKDGNPQYSMAMSNFLAETVKFFLQDESMVKFVSDQQSQWKTFTRGKTYYFDIVLKKSPDLVMVEAYSGSMRKGGKVSQFSDYESYTMNGRYFGYPVDKENNTFAAIVLPNAGTIHNDPAYAPYTPPYFEGEAIMRMSFKPTETRKYTLDEIFSEVTGSDLFSDLSKQISISSSAFLNKMSLEASLNLFGVTLSKDLEFDLGKKINNKIKFTPKTVKDSIDEGKRQWVISPKMETPVLNFSNQPFIAITSSLDLFTGSDGFGRGMWSGYGTIPTSGQGIFLEIRESFPVKNLKTRTLSGSLLTQLGFKSDKKKIGQLADEKEISEAVVLIPYVDNAIPKVTTPIAGYNFIKIDKNIFNVQRNNIENGEPAIKVGNLKSPVEIQETSISKMISVMEDYVIPPQFNFMEYTNINPFVMYIVEFKHTLDQQDLADIWQGVMPKIAKTAELDEIELDHPSGKFEFFADKELPENLRWLVFKIKKKAEKDYFTITEDVSDDNRFTFKFKRGRKEPEYSYNWPYDYFSLVEFAKVEVFLEYVNKDLLAKPQINALKKDLIPLTKTRGRPKR